MKLTIAAVVVAAITPLIGALDVGGGFSSSSLQKNDNIKFSVSENGGVTDDLVPRQLQSSADFEALTCNEVAWTCTPWPFGESAGDVKVPCGTCYSMENYVNGENITLSGVLNVEGKLDFPDGTKVNLVTKGIVVQGELAMTSTKSVDGNPDVKIQLEGTDDVLFTPEAQNSAACGGASCNLGPKPFVVAGGKLDINALPDTCPTWTTIADYSSGAQPEPTEYRKAPTLPIPSVGTCTSTFLSEAFEGGFGRWYGNLGAKATIVSGSHDGSQYMKVSDRTGNFQGPMFDINRYMRECLIAEQDYLFRAMVRVNTVDGVSSRCTNLGSNCPQVRLSHMDSADSVRFRTLISSLDFQDNTWTEIRGSFRLSAEQVANENIFTVLVIDGPEPGLDIDIDDIEITLPSSDIYPDPNNVCGNLIQNGNADLDGFAAPMYPFIGSNTIIVDDDGAGNNFFTVKNRKAKHDSMAMDLTPGCLESGSTYSFSMNIKVDSDTEVHPKVITKTHTDGAPIFDIIADCPTASTAKGWVTCASDFSFKAHHTTSPKVELLMYLKDDSTSDVHFDSISFTFKSGGIGSMSLSDADDVIPSCWSAGAEVVFPSGTLLYSETTLTTLVDIQPGAVIDTADTVDPLPTSVAQNPNAPGEIGLLSRNIVFENFDDDQTGPSLTVLSTPAVPQKIQGVEFIGFGMEAVSGRHPINFKQSGNSTGSLVSKNSIRNSLHRCVNIHATNNVVVSENVAYDTFGHCFSLEGEGETGNVFTKNLGAYTRKPATAAQGSSDTTPATFYVTYPTNEWIGNSAAGSEAYGFWFEFNRQLQDQANSWYAALTKFEDNTSHSNNWFGLRTSPYGYNPYVKAFLLNSKIYKNRGQGMFTHNTGNVVIDGGYFANNKISIDVMQDNDITIQNATIVGFSSDYKDLAQRRKGTPSHCNANGFSGIRLHIREKDFSKGQASLENIAFSGFDTDCSSAAYAIEMNQDTTRGSSFSTKVSITNLSFDGFDSDSNKINFCKADAEGISDIILTDVDGSLNPANTGSGFIKSTDGLCTVMTGTCAQFCPDADAGVVADVGGIGDNVADIQEDCLVNTNFESGTSGWRAVRSGLEEIVPGYSGSGKAIKIIDRTSAATGSAWQDFSTSCLTLDSWYEIKADVLMTDKGTDNVFDCNPTIMWSNDPMSCAGIGLFRASSSPPLKEYGFTVGPYDASGWAKIYGIFKATTDIMTEASLGLVIGRAATTADITVDNVEVIPAGPEAVGVTNCTRPLVNGDAEIGDHRAWWIFGVNNPNTRIELSPGYGGNGYAFKHTGSRDKRNRGMLQKMDNSCFESGTSWNITAKFRYFQEDGTFVACDKQRNYVANACPAFQLIPGGVFTKPPLVNLDEAEMVVGEWNDIKSTFTVETGTDDLEMYILVNSVNPGFNYELDNIEIIPA